MQKDETLGALRHLLSALGGLVVVAGYLDAANVEPIVNAVVSATGAGMTLTAIILSIRSKRKSKAQ